MAGRLSRRIGSLPWRRSQCARVISADCAESATICPRPAGGTGDGKLS